MAAKVMQLVDDLVGQGRWDEAHAVLSRYAGQNPADAQISYRLGLLSYNLGKLDEAQQHLQDSLKSRPDVADTHYHLGLTLLKMNRFAEAMAEFRETCERKDGFAAGHLHWGIALASMGSHRGALGQYNLCLKLNPDLVVAQYQAGMSNYHLGQYKQAADCFFAATRADPNLAAAFNGLGLSLLALNQPAEAGQYFASAWQTDPQMMVSKRNWAYALMKQNQWAEASKHYQEALGSKLLDARQRALLFNDWGVALFRLGKSDEAAEKLKEACEVDPTCLAARLNLGLVENARLEHEQAAIAFEAGLKLQPDLADIYLFCGVTDLFLGRYQEAANRFKLAREKGYVQADLDLWAGYAEIALGHVFQATSIFEQLESSQPGNYLALDGLGVALSLSGEHARAAETFRLSLSINPDYGLGHLHLARALEALNQIAQAQEEFRLAVSKDRNCLEAEKQALSKMMQMAQYELVLNRSLKLLDIAPHDADAQLTAALALKSQNRLPEALQLLNSMIQDHPQNGSAHALMARIYAGQGKLSEADENFRAAALLFDGDLSFFYTWGKTLSLLGLHEVALEKFKKAAEIDPYDADTYDAWGTTLKAMGRFQEAGEVYKKAAEYI